MSPAFRAIDDRISVLAESYRDADGVYRLEQYEDFVITKA